jgi:Large polyvalent protein associated domain 38/Type III restriction enzyme, res subunit
MSNPFDFLDPQPQQAEAESTNPFDFLDAAPIKNPPLPPVRPTEEELAADAAAKIPLPPERPKDFNPADTTGLTLDEPGPTRMGGALGDKIVGSGGGNLTEQESYDDHASNVAAAEAAFEEAKVRAKTIREQLAAQPKAPGNSVSDALTSFDERLTRSRDNDGSGAFQRKGIEADPTVIQADKDVLEAEKAMHAAQSAAPKTLGQIRDKSERLPSEIGKAIGATVDGAQILSDGLPDLPGKLGMAQKLWRQIRNKVEDKIAEDFHKKLSPDEARDQELGSQVMQGLASTAVIGAAGAAGAAAGAPTMLTLSMVAGLPQAAQMYREAEKAEPNNEWKKWAAYAGGIGMGPMEALPIGRLFARLEHVGKGGLTRWIGSTAAQFGEEGLQEGSQGIVQNLIAAGLYDPHRGLMDGVTDQALVGALSGGVFGGIVSGGAIAANKLSKLGTPVPDAPDPELQRRLMQELTLEPENARRSTFTPPPPGGPLGPSPTPQPVAPGGAPAGAPAPGALPADPAIDPGNGSAADPANSVAAPAAPAAEAGAAAVPNPIDPGHGAVDSVPPSGPGTGTDSGPVPAGTVDDSLDQPAYTPEEEEELRVLLGDQWDIDTIRDMNPEERAAALEEARENGAEPYSGELPAKPADVSRESVAAEAPKTETAQTAGPAPKSGPTDKFDSSSESPSRDEGVETSTASQSAQAPKTAPLKEGSAQETRDNHAETARPPVDNPDSVDPFDAAFDEGQNQADAAAKPAATADEAGQQLTNLFNQKAGTESAGQSESVSAEHKAELTALRKRAEKTGDRRAIDWAKQLEAKPDAGVNTTAESNLRNVRAIVERAERNKARADRNTEPKFKSEGTKLTWDNLHDWMDGNDDLDARRSGEPKNKAIERHWASLAEHGPKLIRASKDPAELERLVHHLKAAKRESLGRQHLKNWEKLHQLATDRLAQVQQGRADNVKKPRVDKREPKTLIEHIMKAGGLVDMGGELRARDLHRHYRPGWGSLVRKNGMSLDKGREHATELGYLQPHETIDDFLNLIEEEAKRGGKKAKTLEEQNYEDDSEQDPAQHEHEVRGALLDTLEEIGVSREDGEPFLETALELVTSGKETNLATAWERAIMKDTAEDAEMRAAVEQEFGDELPGWDDEKPNAAPVSGSLPPGFDEVETAEAGESQERGEDHARPGERLVLHGTERESSERESSERESPERDSRPESLTHTARTKAREAAAAIEDRDTPEFDEASKDEAIVLAATINQGGAEKIRKAIENGASDSEVYEAASTGNNWKSFGGGSVHRAFMEIRAGTVRWGRSLDSQNPIPKKRVVEALRRFFTPESTVAQRHDALEAELAGDGEKGDDWFDKMGELSDLKEELAKELGKGAGALALVSKRSKDGQAGAVVSRNSDGEGAWRFTRFDKDGFSGHMVFDSKEEAVLAALKEGYRDTNRDVLRQVSKLPSFTAGNEFTDKLHQGQKATKADDAPLSLEEAQALADEYFPDFYRVATNEGGTRLWLHPKKKTKGQGGPMSSGTINERKEFVDTLKGIKRSLDDEAKAAEVPEAELREFARLQRDATRLAGKGDDAAWKAANDAVIAKLNEIRRTYGDEAAKKAHAQSFNGWDELKTEKTHDGVAGQTVIPGTEKISDAEQAQRKANEKLKPKAQQKDTDGLGLFSDGHKQTGLFTAEEAPVPKSEAELRTEAEQIYRDLKALNWGPADNFAAGFKAVVDGKFPLPKDFAFHRQKLADFRAQAAKGDVREPVSEPDKTLENLFLSDPAEIDAFRKILEADKGPRGDALRAAIKRWDEIRDRINAAGFKMADVNSGSPRELYTAKGYLGSLSGSVARAMAGKGTIRHRDDALHIMDIVGVEPGQEHTLPARGVENRPKKQPAAQLDMGMYGTPSQPLKFYSGMSRPGDFTTLFRADKNVGITVKELSSISVPKLAEAIAASKGYLFVDSGALGIFMANLRRKAAGEPELEFGGDLGTDFDTIMRQYEELHLAIARADNAGYTAERVFFVMPDVVGNQRASLDLVKKYAQQVNDYSLRAIVPLQVGELSFVEAYETMMRNLGLNPETDLSPILGIPSREEAVSNEELKALFAKHGDRIMGVHILGAVADKTLAPRLEALKAAGYDGNTSADANRLRALMNAKTPRAVALQKLLKEEGGPFDDEGETPPADDFDSAFDEGQDQADAAAAPADDYVKRASAIMAADPVLRAEFDVIEQRANRWIDAQGTKRWAAPAMEKAYQAAREEFLRAIADRAGLIDIEERMKLAAVRAAREATADQAAAPTTEDLFAKHFGHLRMDEDAKAIVQDYIDGKKSLSATAQELNAHLYELHSLSTKETRRTAKANADKALTALSKDVGSKTATKTDTRSEAFKRLEALNVELANSGNYNQAALKRRHELWEAIEAARKSPEGKTSKAYIDGIEAAINRAIDAQIAENTSRAPKSDILERIENLSEEDAKDARREDLGEQLGGKAGRRNEEKKTRTKKEIAKSAVKNAADSADAAGAALSALFNSKNRPGSGFTFDDETYAQAKPLFKKFATKFAALLSDLNALVVAMVKDMRENLGLTREGMEAMRPYLRRFIDDVKSGTVTLEEENDVSGPGDNLEQDSGESGTRDDLGATDVSPSGRGARRGSGGRGGSSRPRRGGKRDARGGVLEGHAPALGEEGDSGVHGGASGDGSSPSERGDGIGSGNAGESGLLDNETGTEQVAATASDAPDVASREAAQAAAESIPVELGNLENIRATLPMLLPKQQEDVHKAEERFAKPDGHGMLFTNGTGTGKTFSGLGIVKRFARQGKTNILIVAPSQGILEDWVKSAKRLGLDVSVLENTQTAGKGIVATTYANLGENQTLGDRSWDLVIGDESQNFSANAAGEQTKPLRTLRAITHHPNGIARKVDMRLRDKLAKLEKLRAEEKALRASDDQRNWARASEVQAAGDVVYRLYLGEAQELQAQFQAEPRSKVVFLSATPFAYDTTVDYAEGYLFNYPADTGRRGYNVAQGRDAFFIQHFGYRMRTGRLTKPDAGVNSEILERQFHEHLRSTGALSGRRLDVEADYERHFVLVEDSVGQKIDEALEWLSSQPGNRFRGLNDIIASQFDYLTRQRLLEAIKAHHAVSTIKKDLAHGRKVVVFHDFNQGGGFDPFVMPGRPADKYTYTEYPDGVRKPSVTVETTLGEVWADFERANPYIRTLNFSQMGSPLVTLQAAFPNALVYNGTVSNKKRSEAKRLFNEDNSGYDLIIVQSAAGEAGISLHDTSGTHQRALHNLGMPTKPTTAIQEEGRIYRTGQVSDAIFRYYNTGTSWERWTFANKIATRSSTAENLALGEEARALRESFVDAFNDAALVEPHEGEGKGGKAKDQRAGGGISLWDRAKTHYWAQQRTQGRRDQREGNDYYATPEPIGLKMVQLAGLRTGERALEPSAGHGAIARYFPEDTNRTLIEPSSSLLGRAALAAHGARTIQDTFENHHITNKYHAIVMNPPFGMGGKQAFEHVAKAAEHLRNGGRIVALVPMGPTANKRYEQFMESEAARDLYPVADLQLPGLAFERAGTSIATRIVVLEKQKDKAAVAALPQGIQRDYTGVENINELFDRMEHLELPPRVEPETEDEEPLENGDVQAGDVTFKLEIDPETNLITLTGKKRDLPWDRWKRFARLAKAAGASYAAWGDRRIAFTHREAFNKFVEAANNPEAAAPATAAPTVSDTGVSGMTADSFELGQTKHSKTGDDLFVATNKQRTERDVYDRLQSLAKANGGWYSAYRGAGAIPGFQFKSAEARQKFLEAVTGTPPATQAQVRAQMGSQELGDLLEQIRNNPELQEIIQNDPELLHKLKEAILADIKVRVIGDHVALKFSDPSHTDRKSIEASQGGREGPFEVIAQYAGNRIITLGPKADVESIHHEVFHALQHLGAFTDQEVQLLVQELERNRRTVAAAHGLPVEKATYSDDEVGAYAYGLYAAAMDSGVPGAAKGIHMGLRRLFERVRKTARRVINLLTGAGFQISEDVFERVRKGEFKARLDAVRAGTREAGLGYGAVWEWQQQRNEREALLKEGYPVSLGDQWESASQVSQPQVKRTFEPGTIAAIEAANTAAGWVSTRAAPSVPSFPTPAKQFGDTSRENFQDSFLFLERVQKAIEDSRAAALRDGVNPYQAQQLYHGRGAERLADFKKRYVDPLVKEIADGKVTPDEVGVWLIAKHAKERNALMAQRDPTRFSMDNGSGLADAAADALINQLIAEGKEPALERIAQRVYQIIEFDKQNRYNNGLISKDTKDHWDTLFPSGRYVPLRGFAERDEDHEGSTHYGRGFDIRGREAKVALGRESLADNPLPAVLHMAMEGIIRVEKNNVGKSLLKLVRAFPNDDVWHMVRNPTMKVLRENPLTGVWETKEIPDPRVYQKESVLAVKVGGVPYYVDLLDPSLAKAFKRLGVSEFTKTMQVFSKIMRFYSQLQTGKNPEFFIRNAVRDYQSAWTYAGMNGFGTKFTPQGWLRAFATTARIGVGLNGGRLHRNYEDWRLNGGKISNYNFKDIDELHNDVIQGIAELNAGPLTKARRAVWRKFWAMIDGLNEMIESATRFAAYNASLEAGHTKAKAAFHARNATVNFTKKGHHSSKLNLAYMFSNANIQGSAQHLGWLVKSRKLQMVWGVMAASGFLMNMLARQMGDDDEEKRRPADDVPEYVRRHNIVVPLGTRTDDQGNQTLKYSPIPLMFGFQIPYYFGDQVASVVSGRLKADKAAWNILTATLDAFNPLGDGNLITMAFPTLAKLPIELALNENYQGRNIYPKEERWNKGLPHSGQPTNITTSPLITDATKWVNAHTGGNDYKPGMVDVYPGAVQHTLEWLGGGAGRFGLNTARWVWDVYNGVETPDEKTPIKRQFVGETNGQGEQQRYYEQKDELEERKNRYRSAKKAIAENPDNEAAGKVLEEEAEQLGVSPDARKKTKWKGSAADAFTQSDKQIRSLRRQKQDVMNDSSLTRFEQTRRSKEIDGEIRTIQKDARINYHGKLPQTGPAPQTDEDDEDVQEAAIGNPPQQAGIWSSITDTLFGPPGTKTLETEPQAGYPTRDDAEFARKSGFGYGRDQKAIDGDEMNVAGRTEKVTQPPAKKGQKPTVLEKFMAADIDDDGGRMGAIAAKAVTPGQSKRMPTDNPELRDGLTQGALAINRSAIATLGYDPQRVAFDVKSGATTVGGMYQAKGKDGKPLDSMWVNAKYPFELPHESIHRGLEKVRQDRPDLFKDFDVDEETQVRQIMRTTMGNPEKGSGDEADKQLERSRYIFDQNLYGPTQKKRLAAIEAHAAEMIRRDRPRGGPR